MQYSEQRSDMGPRLPRSLVDSLLELFESSILLLIFSLLNHSVCFERVSFPLGYRPGFIMPRSMPIRQVVTTLSGLIGRDSARLELKWLTQASRSAENNTQSLSTMLNRRIRGEPLQYILGKAVAAPRCFFG